MQTYSSTEPPYPPEANASGVSWAAIIGGAFVTAALWLTLTILGVGLGLSAMSPWTGAGGSSTAIGAGAIIWLIVTQIIASGLGGYLAGRLRLKWVAVHDTEVYFRDTAHGLLVWAVAVVVSAAFLGTALSTIAGSGLKMTAAAAGVSATQPAPAAPGPAVPGGNQTAPGAAGNPSLAPAPTPGPQAAVTPAEMEQARRAAAKTSIWMFIALLIGAFCASIAATLGGRQRDCVSCIEVDREVSRT